MWNEIFLSFSLIVCVSCAVYQTREPDLVPQLDINGIRLSDVVQPSDSVPLSRKARQACDLAPVNLSASYQQMFVDIHNSLRSGEEAPGMFTLRWNDELGQRAQAWANIIVRQATRPHGYLTLCNGSTIGQNIWWSMNPSNVNITSSIFGWFNEKIYYTRKTNTCNSGETCGHYTQVVWASTYFVGCGSATNNTLKLIICNYYPPGNWAGEAPYLAKKPGVLACQNTTALPPQPKWGVTVNSKGLCDFCSGGNGKCTCYPCQNNGTLNANTCACGCQTGYQGNVCEVNCHDSAAAWKCNLWGQYCNQSSYQTFMQNNCPCHCYNTVGIKTYKCCV